MEYSKTKPNEFWITLNTQLDITVILSHSFDWDDLSTITYLALYSSVCFSAGVPMQITRQGITAKLIGKSVESLS